MNQIDESVMHKRLLNIEETANYLGISVRTIYNQVCRKAKKKFPVKAKRIGRRILFDIRELESYVDSL
jgi:predicted DNA-binding transcriptional regulator AlpA